MHAHGRTCDNRGRDWGDEATNQGIPINSGNDQKLGRGKKEFSCTSFRES